MVVHTDHFLHQQAFALDEFVDALLEAIFGDQFKDLHALMLTDAVNAVGGLVLAGFVPPAVVMDDHGGGCEVDAEASGAQRGDEDLAFGVVVKELDLLAAVARSTANASIADAVRLEMVFNDVKHAEILYKPPPSAHFHGPLAKALGRAPIYPSGIFCSRQSV